MFVNRKSPRTILKVSNSELSFHRFKLTTLLNAVRHSESGGLATPSCRSGSHADDEGDQVSATETGAVGPRHQAAAVGQPRTEFMEGGGAQQTISSQSSSFGCVPFGLNSSLSFSNISPVNFNFEKYSCSLSASLIFTDS